MSIFDLRSRLDDKKITAFELRDEAVAKAKKYQDEYNSFVTIIDDYPINEVSNVLSGIPYALKDNLSTKGILTTASSNILKDYVPCYDATAYKKLKEKGAVLIGKTVLDELAMGGTGTTGHTGVVKNPWDSEHLIGGSSAGSATAVALGIVPFALGSDTGDSIRKPASNGGIVGYKPTYGLISRYGLFAFASSMDHIGCFTRNVMDAAIVVNELKGHDDKDLTSLEDDNKDLPSLITNDVMGKKGFYIKEVVANSNNDSELTETINKFNEVIDKCKDLGMIVDEVSIDKDLLMAIYPTYITISCAEATSNNANLTGLFYGIRNDGLSADEIMIKNRTEGFSKLIKRRFVLGSYVLLKENQDKLFLNACRIRRMIVDKINKLFEEYDFMILPAAGGPAPKFGKETDQLSDRYLIIENHLAIANFGGMPSITIPMGFVNDMPVGVNITSKARNDEVALNVAYKLESIMTYKDEIAKGAK